MQGLGTGPATSMTVGRASRGHSNSSKRQARRRGLVVYILLPMAMVALAAAVFMPLLNSFYISPWLEEHIVRGVQDEAMHIGAHLSRLTFENDGRMDSLAEIREHAVHMLADNVIHKVKVFDPSGRVFFSTDESDIGTLNGHAYFREKVARGEPFSKMVRKRSRTLEGQLMDADVVETYAPVMKDGRFMGAFEIYYDVSGRIRDLKQLNSNLQRLILTFAGLLVAALGIAFVRAYHLLRQQEETERALDETVERLGDEMARTASVVAAIGDGVSIQSEDFRVLYQNSVHADLVGGNHVGRCCYEAYRGADMVCEGCPVLKTFQDGQTHTAERTFGAGRNVYEVLSSPIHDHEGRITAAIETVRDISQRKQNEEAQKAARQELESLVQARTAELSGELAERKRAEEELKNYASRMEKYNAELREAESRILNSLHEKDVLLKEVHHRVKNNMQVISSILSLQTRHIADEAASEMFAECRNRIRTMAMVHELLYQSKDFRNIDLKRYVIMLISQLRTAYSTRATGVSIDVNVADVEVVLDQIIPCGLIINELVSNSFKYAFSPDREGHISIIIGMDSGRRLLRVSDNGTGIEDEGFDIGRSGSLGLRLVSTLAEQLGGELDVNTTGGMSVGIRF